MSNTPPNDQWWQASQGEPPPPPPPPGGYPPPPGDYPPPQQGGYPPPSPGGYPPPGGGYQQTGSWGGGSYPPQGGGYGQYPPPPPVDPRYQYGQQSTGYVLAGWWYRVGATIIDGLVLLIPNIFIAVGGGGRWGWYVGGGLIDFLYISIMLALRGQTVGNMALGTRVVDSQTGAAISGGKAVGRAGAQLLFEVFSFLFVPILLDYLWPLWDKDNQTLHDKMAGTVVLKNA